MKRAYRVATILFFAMFSMLIFLASPVLAKSNYIAGPNAATVSIGQPIRLNFRLQLPDSNNGMNYLSSAPDIINGSKKAIAYFDFEADDIGGESNATFSVYVAGLKAGTSTFTIKAPAVINDIDTTITKTVSVKIKKGKSICINGGLYGYNTRSKKFTTFIKNYSSKSIKILSSGSKAIDSDSKSWDRSLRISGKSSVTIKPGKTKKITFVVKGRRAWSNYQDYYIKCKCKYNKKTYELRLYPDYGESDSYCPEYVKVKIKGKWKNTMLCVPDLEHY